MDSYSAAGRECYGWLAMNHGSVIIGRTGNGNFWRGL